MRKLWPKWRRVNLWARGKGKNRRPGWIEKYNWKEALKLQLERRPQATLNADWKLASEIESVRQTLYEQITSQGAAAGKDAISQHLRYCQLSIDALTKVEAECGTLAGFVDFWEMLLEWLPEIDENATRALVRVSDEILNRVAAEYGVNQEQSPKGP
jgi:hypothetical protein